MKISFNFPDDAWDGIQESFAVAYARPENVLVSGELVSNPESKGAHAIRKVMDYISDIWGAYSINLAIEQSKLVIASGVNERVAQVKQYTTVSIE